MNERKREWREAVILCGVFLLARIRTRATQEVSRLLSLSFNCFPSTACSYGARVGLDRIRQVSSYSLLSRPLPHALNGKCSSEACGYRI
ncbi:hypothetical protein HOY82DRAFT_240546 [Tuber indicum]|nr:hypothetical protein HOY82DRAFT_240546 [Tuber indicum]